MSNTFQGFVRNENLVRILGPLMSYRIHNGLLKNPHTIPKTEKIVYIGCIHGAGNWMKQELRQIAKGDEQHVIFAGDLTGSPEVEKLKKHFYNEKAKVAQNAFNKYVYFGDWVATLPVQKRKELLRSIEISTKELMSYILNIQKAGKRVYLLEGNWDNPQTSGIKAIAGDDIPILFSTKQIVHGHELSIIDTLKTIETHDTFHILLPYKTLLEWDIRSVKERHEGELIKEESLKAKKQGKTIVMVGHAEVNWKMHHLQQENPHAGGQRAHLIHNFVQAIAYFIPDEVIYPHQHARIQDEQGKLIPVEQHYVIHINPDGHVSLKERAKNVTENDVLIQYVPFRYAIEESFH
jgi:hypothetical protein